MTLLRTRRLRAEEDGSVAVEFALILPVMLFLLMGLIELTDAIAAKRRVAIAASTMTDLLTNSRFDWVRATEVDAVLKATGDVLRPYGVGDATMRVTTVKWDATRGEAVVVWSVEKTAGGALGESTAEGYRRDDAFTATSGKAVLLADEELVGDGYHMVVGQISYPYDPPVVDEYGSFEISQTEVRVPRREEKLHYCDGNDVCTDGRVYKSSLGRPVNPAP